MKRTLATILVLVTMLGAIACDGAGGSAFCPSGTYIGDLHGAPATARVELSESPNFNFVPGSDYNSAYFDGRYIRMAGDIQSTSAYYTFSADIYGTSGYGDAVDSGGSRFRIHIQLTTDGFVLTSNPFEGTGTTSYVFRCQ